MATTTVPYLSGGTTITTITGQTVTAGNTLVIQNGGTAINTTLDKGEIKVSFGGTVDGTIVSGGIVNGYSRGILRVYSGGIAKNTTVNLSGTFLVSATGNGGGTASNTTVNNGGFMSIGYNGNVTSTTVKNGGIMAVLGPANGGPTTPSVEDTKVEAGGSMTISGTAIISGLENRGGVVIGEQGAGTYTVIADKIDTKDGTFTAYGKYITLTGINQTPLQLDGKITLNNDSYGTNLSAMISGGTTGAMISGGTTGGTIEAQGMVTVIDSIITANTFNAKDYSGTYAELKFTGSNTLNNVDLTLTTSIDAPLTTAGSTTVDGTLTVTNSTLTNKWLWNRGTITMNSGSTITADSVTTGGTINATDGTTMSVTGKLGNSVVLVLDDLPGTLDTSASTPYTVTISDGTNSWASTSYKFKKYKNPANQEVQFFIVDFGSNVIPEGSYTVTITKNSNSEVIKTYTNYSVESAAINLTGSTINAASVTNAYTITMDAKSTITAESLSNTGTGVIINGSASEFSTYAEGNMKKVIDLSSGTTKDEKINLGSSATGLYLVYHAQDYWVADVDQTTMYVDGAWAEKSGGGSYSYGEAVEEQKYFGYNAFDEVNDAVTKAETAADPTRIVVVGGSYDTKNAPTFNGIETTIEDGTFDTSVCGGKFFDAGGEVSGNINFSIAGGTFSKLVFAGDRVNGGVQQTRTGNLTTTITNGVFNSAVAGGMLVTVATTNAVLKGDVLLTIKGGNFSDWIYGGGLASKKSFGGATTIEGNVTVKLDSSESGSNGLKLSTTLVVGSYGAGHIGTEQDKKNTKLILTGGKDIELSGEIWGGCSSDIITTNTIPDKGNNRKVDSTVTGNRILSFTGFNGHLTTQKNRIRAFSDIELKGNSTVTLNNYGSGSVNLSDVVNWTFEYGSSLTGDFINDFNGDTLNLTGFSGTGTFNLMSYSDASNTNDIFNGFGQLNGVELNGAAGSYRNGAWEWDNASLAINNGIMQLTIA